MYAVVFLLTCLAAPPDGLSSPPPGDAWVEGLPGLLTAGTTIQLIDHRVGDPVSVISYSAQEAQEKRAPAAPYVGRFRELQERAKVRVPDPDAPGGFRSTDEEAVKGIRAIYEADQYVTVLGCGDGRLTYRDSSGFQSDGSRAFYAISIPLRNVASVFETPARYAERTGAPLPDRVLDSSPADELD